ncbi:hypothetical protein SARC_03773 [Sphaeroforma arctica JP610]|uniref:Uncharacterized protein n=1 Tax=Sphaeroforma arctica JP610 TaxID=667725 RepID=A0A0L0G4K2_9EUKA|nr:hypothetical protein SARC_03773 [Sphaeroforma arctica JP610]KNC84012.1 hypothetical protein SARC_03773 [Sphaeroforma arctica JP610]|eukprot:XP_014157914.1 hypothetical protein SARC_03773 [Sphaeroforma arctica JP610]
MYIQNKKTWKFETRRKICDAIRYGVTRVGDDGSSTSAESMAMDIDSRDNTGNGKNGLDRLRNQGVIRMCDESEQYLTHNTLMILKSDGLRARLILDPLAINKRARI